MTTEALVKRLRFHADELKTVSGAEELIDDLASAIAALSTPSAGEQETALQRYSKFTDEGGTAESPVERLRFFLSLALKGQDWIDVEPFIDAVSDTRRLAMEEEDIEMAYWRFDARRKGYSDWKGSPQSERDAFKAEFRALAVQQPGRKGE